MGVARPGGVNPAEELRALLALRLLPHLGDRTLLGLVRAQGSARAVLDLPYAPFAAAAGEAAAKAREDPTLGARIAGVLDRCDSLQVRILPFGAPDYPASLLPLHDPPPLLFLRGVAPLPGERAAAVVGSRMATPVGRRVAERLGRELSEAGVTVVSGMALGIDGAAQQGALGGSGGTVAVLGSGVDRPHPTAHRELFLRILEEGLVVSEFLPGDPPRPFHFPRRNRIIAALSRAVVVVEAAGRSGALGTVEHALDLGLEVFALPGSVESPQSAGTNALLRDGAHLLTRGEDLLSTMGWDPPLPPDVVHRGSSAEKAGAPRTLDDLAEALALPAATLLAELTRRELRGEASRHPDGWILLHPLANGTLE